MLFFPLRSSLTKPSSFNCESWVEIRLWPMPRISWSSATDRASVPSSIRIRNRVGSDMSFSDFSIDGM